MPVAAAVPIARALGAGRALLGAALLVAPDLVTVRWVGADAASPAGRVLARGLGGRDVVLGAAAALTAGSPAGAGWIAGGVAADVADLLATTALGAGTPRGGRLGTAALAGGSAALGAWLVRSLESTT